MRSLLVLCVLVGCGSGDGDDCDAGGDATTIDLHTTAVLGDILDARDRDPVAVALQDGGPACPWRTLGGNGSGRYQLAVHGTRYAVAVTCPDSLTVLARSLDDGGELTASCFGEAEGTPHELRAHTTASLEPYVIGAFLGASSTLKQGVLNTAIGFLWHAFDGEYDLVALGHRGDQDLEAPDDVRVVRDLRAADAFDIDVTPTASSDWLALGPPVLVTAGRNTIASLRYRTTHGTFVDLGTAVATVAPVTVSAPTLPAAARAAGEIYEQAIYVDDFSAGKSFSVTRETVEPTAFDMALPAVFDVTLDRTTFAFAPLADATHYEVGCVAIGSTFTSNVSVGWLRDGGTYELPSIPGVRYPDDCRWGATALGRTPPSDVWRSSTGVRGP